MDRNEVFAEIKSRGCTRAVVAFSGGNDEGGPDWIRLYAGADDVDLLAGALYVELPLDDAYTDGTFEEALCAPIYARYHSFAAEFYVSGTLTWNAENRTVEMSGDEEVAHSESFHYGV